MGSVSNKVIQRAKEQAVWVKTIPKRGIIRIRNSNALTCFLSPLLFQLSPLVGKESE